jgi:hypothetical protein
MNKTCVSSLAVVALLVASLCKAADTTKEALAIKSVLAAKSLQLRGLDFLLDGGSLIYTFGDEQKRSIGLTLRNEFQYKSHPREVLVSVRTGESTDESLVPPKSRLEARLIALIEGCEKQTNFDEIKRATLKQLIDLIADRDKPLPPLRSVHRFKETGT